MASLRHQFDLLEIRGSPATARAFNARLNLVMGNTSAAPLALANMLRVSGWQLDAAPNGSFHIYGYADVGGSRVRDSLRWLEAIAPLLTGRLLYQDIRGLLLDFHFGPKPRLERLGRREYDLAVAQAWQQGWSGRGVLAPPTSASVGPTV